MSPEELARRFPNELKELNQWCLWREIIKEDGRPTKVPYQPNGQKASVTDARTYSSYSECFSVISQYKGLGFIFTVNDPYCFLDLDNCGNSQQAIDKQFEIYNQFKSYSEISPSGKGLHIICKASISKGFRLKEYALEVYPHGRFATMTGNVWGDYLIRDCQNEVQLLENLSTDKKPINGAHVNFAQIISDEQVIEYVLNDSEKFHRLFTNGDWREFNYPSQSEADQGLADKIKFFSRNKQQIERIFRKSALANTLNRKGSARNIQAYLNRTIKKSFDLELPQIEFVGTPASVAQLIEPSAHNALVAGSSSAAGTTIQIPSGLLGEIAKFIYAAAPRPVPEIALAGAIGLMAGICGRAYNISGTGLNQYVLLIAPTGSGKESAASGIDRLMNAIRLQVPTSSGFVGPSEIASGQALVKYLSNTSQCFVSILGEFGLRLQQMSSIRANSAEISLRRMLLDLYNKSGHGQVARPSIYADKDKNTMAIQSPSFSILGESTPERFYGALNEEMISEGLLPRFMLINYNGQRPSLSQTHLQVPVPTDLIQKLATLIEYVEKIMHNKTVVNVDCSPEAIALLDNFNKEADEQINSTDKELLRQLWNRAHIKVLKMSALIAVGVNPFNCIVLPEYVHWAIDMVKSDIKSLLSKFKSGEIGEKTNETGQISVLKKLIKEFYMSALPTGSTYDRFRDYHRYKIIPHYYITFRLSQRAEFYKDLKGRTKAIRQVVTALVECGMLSRVTPDTFKRNNLTYIEAFILNDTSLLVE